MVGDHGIPVEMLADGRVRLLEDVTFEIQDLCGVRVEIDVPKGFESDGASIPRAFWSIVGHPMSGGPLRAALIHDHLCNEARTPRARRFADTIFAWVMEESGVPRWRRLAMFWAVRFYGVCVWPWARRQMKADRPEGESPEKPSSLARYLCERCGGTGQQEAGCWTGEAYDSKAGVCDLCNGSGELGIIGEAWKPEGKR